MTICKNDFSFKKGRKLMFDFYLHYGLDIGRISNG